MRENENMVSLYRSTHKGLKTQVRYKRSKGQISLKQKILPQKKKNNFMGEDKTAVMIDEGTVISDTRKQVGLLLQLKRISADLPQGEKTS